MHDNATPAWLDHAYDPATLTPMQRQGLHCVTCDRPWKRGVVVGCVQAPDGFQLFACEGECAKQAQDGGPRG